MNLGDNCQTDLNSSVENRFVLKIEFFGCENEMTRRRYLDFGQI